MEKQLIPQLRFPEFQDLWSFDIVKNRAKKLKVGFVGTCEPFYTDKESGILLIRTGNLKGVDIVLDDVKYVTSNFHQKNVKSQIYPDDLILARHGGKGEICLVPKKFPTANCLNIVILRVDNSVNSKFFQLIYGSTSIQKQIIAVTAGSTQTVINTKEIGKLKFKFPTLPEQQKIASFLTDVDEKITKLTKKKKLLEQYKKGVMQKIFSQELRFKDDEGNAFPEWEEKKLGLIGSIISGLTYSPNDINENGVLVLRSSNVKKRLISLNDNVFVNVEKGKYNPVELNDILICVRNGSKRLIGKNAIIKEEHIGLAFGAFMTVYRSNYNRFLFHFFDSQHYKKEVHKNLGATINSINGGDLKKFKVPFPCEEEQTKIANFLSDIDLKIKALGAKIENSKAFKKGLLQQMFV